MRQSARICRAGLSGDFGNQIFHRLFAARGRHVRRIMLQWKFHCHVYKNAALKIVGPNDLMNHVKQHSQLPGAAFAATLSAYMVLASKVEERDLVDHHGELYESYQRQVPAFVPWPRRADAVCYETQPDS